MPSPGPFAATPLDKASLPQDRLDISKRVRTNPLPWTGQFSPHLVELLLEAYAPRGGIVMDPFVGSGTTLGEAARAGLRSCGSDVNPAAVALARVYQFVTLTGVRRAAVLRELDQRLNSKIKQPCGPLFSEDSPVSSDRDRLEASLVALWRDSRSRWTQILAAALVILCDFHQKHLDPTKVYRAWKRLCRVVRSLPESDHPVSVQHADARDLPFESESVDLVLTSPPYINVFNYHQKFRRSVEALDWNVLAFARSEIGSNRQNRGNRFLTVAQYAMDMVLAIRETARVTKTSGHLIFIMGRESTVRGTSFFNGEIVAELAVRGVGLELERRQERRFQNRYGVCIYEDILHFKMTEKPLSVNSCLVESRSIAKRALEEAWSRTPIKERSGLQDAIERLPDTSPSPMQDAQLRFSRCV